MKKIDHSLSQLVAKAPRQKYSVLIVIDNEQDTSVFSTGKFQPLSGEEIIALAEHEAVSSIEADSEAHILSQPES